MKKIVGIILLTALIFFGCDTGTNTIPDNPEIPTSITDPVDPAFWFKDIYDDLMYRQVNSIMGTIANTQYVCDAINAKWGAGTVTPEPGTELQAANCEYLLKTIDMANAIANHSTTSFGTGSYATLQAVDTIAVDAAVNTLWVPGSKFVAVGSAGNYGSIGKFCYSIDDGITWTEGTMPSNGYWSKVIYGNGKYVAISNNTYNKIAYSTDGINWTVTTPSADNLQGWYGVAYGNGKFVAISNNMISVYSTDGINWTETAMLPGIWSSITYGNGKFVALNNNSNHNKAAYSTDGINWTETAIIANPNYTNTGPWNDVTYGNGKFVAVGSIRNQPSGATYSFARVAYSTDGINWTQISSASNGNIAYGNGKFVRIASRSTSYSTDDINWTNLPTGLSSNVSWSGLTYGGY
jgi:hypothetical protein